MMMAAGFKVLWTCPLSAQLGVSMLFCRLIMCSMYRGWSSVQGL